MSDARSCLIFPGQGAHERAMLNELNSDNHLKHFYSLTCKAIEEDLLEKFNADSELINQNRYSSLVTVLASAARFERYREKLGLDHVKWMGGYSIGQWTAIYASGAISFETLVKLVLRRAELMDECVEGKDLGMAAVIGLKQGLVESLCAESSTPDSPVQISNNNAPGQLTIAGPIVKLKEVIQKCLDHQAKKAVLIPVSGAWHSPYLESAAKFFREDLDSITFEKTPYPVFDNATGDLLESNLGLSKDSLARQICKPVLWRDSIEKAISLGASEFVEIGYGNTLSKFGFFINRKVKHLHVDKLCAE